MCDAQLQLASRPCLCGPRRSFINGGFFAMRCHAATARFWSRVLDETLQLRPGDKGAAARC